MNQDVTALAIIFLLPFILVLPVAIVSKISRNLKG